MSEARIGRIAVGALHQALADHLPLRLEFYESYLRPMGMRAGTIGVASYTAALSFLRLEGDAYDPVVRSAGRLAADWLFAEVSPLRRALMRRLPRSWRLRAAMKLAVRLAGMTVRGSRGRIVNRGGRRELVIAGSPFCGTRLRPETPLCGYYAAALQRFFERLDVAAGAESTGCRATGGDECVVSVTAPAALPVAAHEPSGRKLS